MSVKLNIDRKNLQKLVQTVRKMQKGDTPKIRSIMNAVALGIQGKLLRDFNDRSRRVVRKWKPISPITYLLRTPSGKKARSMKEVQLLAQKSQILADKGRLRGSLSGRAGFVKRIKGLRVTVGTNVPYAKFHQQTPATKQITKNFKPTAKQIRNFDANFSNVKGGSKPKRTPTGRISRAKKNWNEDYFILRNVLLKQKKAGKLVLIPKRAFIPETKREKESYKQLMVKLVREGLIRAFRDR